MKNKDDFLNDKVTFNNAMQKLTKHHSTNYYNLYREYHYKDIKPKIFSEEMLEENNADPTTYKFHIFANNHANNFIQVTTDRFNDYQRSIFDFKWNLTPFGLGRSNENLKHIPQCPQTLSTMIKVANFLASPFDYVRVDLYNTNAKNVNKVIVGELTFTPMCGTDRFYPKEYDHILGNAWNLNIKDSK